MATPTLQLNTPAFYPGQTIRPAISYNVWHKFMLWADTQAYFKTIWFLISLTVQGVFFLPVPAVLMYYYHAPLAVLAATMVLFFSNIIAGMSGSGIRVLITLFFCSIIIHLLMIAIFTTS